MPGYGKALYHLYVISRHDIMMKEQADDKYAFSLIFSLVIQPIYEKKVKGTTCMISNINP